MWGVGGVDVERGRGLGGFEGKRTGSSTSPPRRRRDREEEGDVGPDVRATQHDALQQHRSHCRLSRLQIVVRLLARANDPREDGVRVDIGCGGDDGGEGEELTKKNDSHLGV